MRRVVTIGLAMMFTSGSLRAGAQGQPPVAHIRDLYANAAYEDVVSAIDADTSVVPQVGQYKVFSLIALGRPADAQRAAEGVLADHLSFHPDSDASPRLVEVFATARRKIAPERLTAMYEKARARFDTKDRDGAIKAFTEIVAVAADEELKDDKTIADLGVLANGFLTLSRALPAPETTETPTSAPPKPATPATNGDRAPAHSTSASGLPVITPPQPLREVMPPWTPPEPLARDGFQGRILVHVGTDGRVESAKIIEPIHPLYDDQLLTASKRWLYTPAVRNGEPVAFDRIVEVVLKPRARQNP